MAVSHYMLNAGNTPSGPFFRRWANEQTPVPFTDSYAPLPAGGSVQKTDTLSLRPGANRLTLTLDQFDLPFRGLIFVAPPTIPTAMGKVTNDRG